MGESRARTKSLFIATLVIGLAIFAVSIYGFLLLRQRPALPASIPEKTVIRVGNVDILSVQDISAALAGKEIGVLVDFFVRSADGTIGKISAPVVAFYAETSFPLIYVLIGVFCFTIGGATFIMKRDDPKARLFYCLTHVFGAALIISGEYYGLHPERWATFLPSLLFILSYAFVPAILLHVSLNFAPAPVRIRRRFLYLPAIAFAGAQAAVFLYAFLKPSVAAIHLYDKFYVAFRVYVMGYVIGAIAWLGLALKKCLAEEVRSQIQWIFFGLTVGAAPFLCLYQAPVSLGFAPLVSEELAAVFFVAVPVAFAIAIVRYRLIDIAVVINRSLVYSLLSIFTIGVYLLVVEVAERWFVRLVRGGSGVFVAAGVFAAAAAFQPAQKKIQKFVDRTFFRQRYDYRRVVMDFNDRARHFVTRDELAVHFLGEVRWAVPVETLSLLLELSLSSGAGQKEGLAYGDPWPAGLPFRFGGILAGAGPDIWASPGAVLFASPMDLSEAPALEAHKIDLIFALPFSPRAGTGRLAFGRKKSGERYSRDDIELIQTMAGELAVNLERLCLQEEVIYERASKEKLDELNRLKTEFISTVSHELRTPMSSIQGLAEILKAGKIENPEQRERYLSLMVGESARLSRFLHNILDFGRIERDAITYNFATADLGGIVREAVDVFRPAIESQAFSLAVHCPDHPVERRVDADAVKQALINLIDNAIKYSEGRKNIEITLEAGDEVEIRVRDHGIGIAAADLGRIFDKFFRAESASRLRPQGAGLGLKITRHIMEAHGGRVRVESEPGRGSTFSLVFPAP
jgi:signal transduction histidine kinase